MDQSFQPYRTYPMPSLTGEHGPVETVAVIGYGNQGSAQALNMRDSGLPVTVGLRENSPNFRKAEKESFLPPVWRKNGLRRFSAGRGHQCRVGGDHILPGLHDCRA